MTDESRKPGGAKTVLGWQTQGWADQLQQQPHAQQPYAQPHNNAQVYAQHAQTHAAAAYQQAGHAPTVQINPGYAQQYVATPAAGTPYASTSPAPSNAGYVAPSNAYGSNPGYPTYGAQGYGTPSNAYGATSTTPSYATGFAAPSNAYGAPNTTPSYATPSNAGFTAPTPSHGAPSTTYGATSTTPSYVTPSNAGFAAPTPGHAAPSTTPSYATPSNAGFAAPSNVYGASSNAYGTPSNAYGAPPSNAPDHAGYPSYGMPSYATGNGTGSQPSYGATSPPGFPSYPSAAAYNQVPQAQRGSSPDVADPKRPIPGADATVGVSQRVRFIRLTYLHLLFAILAFAGLEWALMTVPVLRETISDPFTKFALAGRWNWGVVLGAFMATSYAADYFAQHTESRGVQYMGLLLYVIAEAVIFVPLLAIVEWKTHDILARGGENPNIIRDSAYVTLALFGGLTASVFISKKDFSFLRSGLCMASAGALSLIALSLVFGFNLGLAFSIGMVFLAAGYILFQTSQILEHHDPRQHVSAALELFSSVALMFWYVIRIFLRARE